MKRWFKIILISFIMAIVIIIALSFFLNFFTRKIVVMRCSCNAPDTYDLSYDPRYNNKCGLKDLTENDKKEYTKIYGQSLRQVYELKNTVGRINKKDRYDGCNRTWGQFFAMTDQQKLVSCMCGK